MPSARDKVVEHALLFGESPGVVPLLAELTTAADVRHREHTTLLEPQKPRQVEPRFQRDAKASVRGQQGRARTVAANARGRHQAHRDSGAVRRGRELTAHLVAREVERSLAGERCRPWQRVVPRTPPDSRAGE